MSKWSSAFRDSRWQKKRLEVMESDGWVCRSCGANGEGVTLNVHHAYYEAGKAPWEYEDRSLVTMCEDCHKAFHRLQKILALRISQTEEPNALLEELIGYCDSHQGPALYVGQSYRTGYVGGYLNISEETENTVMADSAKYLTPREVLQ